MARPAKSAPPANPSDTGRKAPAAAVPKKPKGPPPPPTAAPASPAPLARRAPASGFVAPMDASAQDAAAKLLLGVAPAPASSAETESPTPAAAAAASSGPSGESPLLLDEAQRYIGGVARSGLYIRELWKSRSGHVPDVDGAEKDAKEFAGDVAPELLHWPSLHKVSRRVGAFSGLTSALLRMVTNRVARAKLEAKAKAAPASAAATAVVEGQAVQRG